MKAVVSHSRRTGRTESITLESTSFEDERLLAKVEEVLRIGGRIIAKPLRKDSIRMVYRLDK